MTGEIVEYHAPARRDTFGIVADALRLADVICDTELVPKTLKGRPDAVVAVVLAGHELGLGPMQSLQTIDLIQGRPSLSPEGMRALVLAHGHGFKVTGDDVTATATVRRKEWAEGEWESYTFTMDDAVRAELLGNPSWKKYPRAMLYARATSEAARATFADVIAGLSYTPEEIESSIDRVPTPPEKDGPSPGGQVRSRGRSRPSEALDSPPPSPGPAAHTPPPEPGATSLEAVAALEARLDKLAIKDRNDFKAWRKSKGWPMPAAADPEILAVMEAQVTLLEAHAAERRDAYEPPVGSSID